MVGTPARSVHERYSSGFAQGRIRMEMLLSVTFMVVT